MAVHVAHALQSFITAEGKDVIVVGGGDTGEGREGGGEGGGEGRVETGMSR
jgi:siroheme synthase (precorrin-2 oxidase/ferrochelatase)